MRWLIALCLFFNFILSGCGADTTETKENDFAPLTQIIITSEYSFIANKTSNQFFATGNYSNLYTKDITTDVSWTSSAPGVAVINDNGLATAQGPGFTQINASMSGVDGFFFLTVTDATIVKLEISPLDSTVSEGLTEQFEATGLFSDGTVQTMTQSVDWSSVDPDIASIDQTGLASALAEGTTNITARFDGETKTTQLTVRPAELLEIDVTPDLAEDIPQQLNVKFIADGLYSDGTRRTITDTVVWSSDPIAVISNEAGTEGIAYGITTGSAQITASLNSISSSATLTITDDILSMITITPENPTVSVNSTTQLTATGTLNNSSKINITTNVIWGTDNNNATISNSAGTEGLALGEIAGVTGVTATSGNLSSDLTTLTIN